MTELEACRLWVQRDMVSIPQSVIVKLYEHSGYEDMQEVTPWTEEELENVYDYFPAWGWLWAMEDPCDEHWLGENLEAMKECGFRIYESEDYGYVFGINGAGYDFYENHWIPLYRARGFHWHDE